MLPGRPFGADNELKTQSRRQYRPTAGKSCYAILNTGCRRGLVVSGVRRMNEVKARRARIVPGWVTVFGQVYHLGM